MDNRAYKRKLKDLRAMLETGFGAKSWSENLGSIRQQNDVLSKLVGRQTDMPIARPSSLGCPATGMYKAIQNQAKALHRVLQQGFQSSVHCCCQVNCLFLVPSPPGIKLTCEHQLGHGVFLQLKVRGIPATSVGCRFGLTLCFSVGGPTMQIEEGHSACELELEIVDEYEDRRVTQVSPSDSTGVEARNITNITGVQACRNPGINM